MNTFRETRSLRDEQQAQALRQAQAQREQQRKRVRRLLHAAVALGILAALVVIGQAALGPVRLSPVNDAARLVGRRGAGFPVEFSFSHAGQAALLGRNLALLGPTQLDIFSGTAYPGVAFAQPYPQPSIRAAGGRVALFDRSSGKLRLFSRTGELYSMDLGQDIFCVDLNQYGSLAVATKSDSAASEIFVWDASERRRFAWRCESEYPSALRLANNGRSLAMCLIGTEQAGVYARFVDFPLNARQPRTNLRIDGAWLYGAASIFGGWLAVGDQAAYRIRHGDTEPQVFSYEGRGLHSFDAQNNGYTAIVLEDWGNNALLRVYDRRGNLAFEQGFRKRPLDVVSRGGSVYLHFDDVILRWQRGTGFRQSQELSQGTQAVLVTGREAYLLTMRQVELIRIRWSVPEEGEY